MLSSKLKPTDPSKCMYKILCIFLKIFQCVRIEVASYNGNKLVLELMNISSVCFKTPSNRKDRLKPEPQLVLNVFQAQVSKSALGC